MRLHGVRLHGVWMLPLGLLLFVGLTGCGGSTSESESTADDPKSGVNAKGEAAEPAAGQESPTAEIEKLGGTVFLDENSPEKPVVYVDLKGTKTTDAALMRLKGMTKLENLDLTKTQITDAGLEHLKGLTALTSLVLRDTQITDAGLEHLKGLTKLQGVILEGAKVTPGGVEKLKKALPECSVLY